jgi:glutamate carboxypeptidase
VTRVENSPIVAGIEAQRERLLEALRALVEAESPSDDRAALRRCADVVAAVAREFLGVPLERGEVSGVPYLRLDPPGEPKVTLLGHFDTVWPVGTLAERPFRLAGGRAYGPGVLDMKCGLVQALAALSVSGLDDVAILFTGDEELGSPTSRWEIEALARRSDAVLVLEPAAHGALKTARKGVSTYDVKIRGRAAHAGLEPERGVNATLALARIALAVADLADVSSGTTVTPTTATSGASGNTVPGSALLHIDVRAWTDAELARVDVGLRALRPGVKGATIRIAAGPARPPMSELLTMNLFEVARREARLLGLGDLDGAHVGGGSDGNFTAGVGTPTIDGLGPVGEGAHTAEEHVLLSSIAPRSALVAAIIEAIRGAKR